MGGGMTADRGRAWMALLLLLFFCCCNNPFALLFHTPRCICSVILDLDLVLDLERSACVCACACACACARGGGLRIFGMVVVVWLLL